MKTEYKFRNGNTVRVDYSDGILHIDELQWITIRGQHIPIKDGVAQAGFLKGQAVTLGDIATSTAVGNTPKVSKSTLATPAKPTKVLQELTKRICQSATDANRRIISDEEFDKYASQRQALKKKWANGDLSDEQYSAEIDKLSNRTNENQHNLRNSVYETLQGIPNGSIVALTNLIEIYSSDERNSKFKKCECGWANTNTNEIISDEQMEDIFLKRTNADSEIKVTKGKPSAKYDKFSKEMYGKESDIRNGLVTVKQGKPMTHEEADSGRVNPMFNSENATEKGYHTNCQTCVMAYEARIRGFDVMAKPCNSDKQINLSRNTSMAWKGRHDQRLEANNAKEAIQWLNDNMDEKNRYHFGLVWKGNNGDTYGKAGHIVCAGKNKNGAYLYDPQCDKTFQGETLEKLLDTIDFEFNENYLRRVDNLEFSNEYMDYIVEQYRE